MQGTKFLISENGGSCLLESDDHLAYMLENCDPALDCKKEVVAMVANSAGPDKAATNGKKKKWIYLSS